jgi:hypothetical protein
VFLCRTAVGCRLSVVRDDMVTIDAPIFVKWIWRERWSNPLFLPHFPLLFSL